jgi:Fe-S cluster biosynthesis and repair protein YggX
VPRNKREYSCVIHRLQAYIHEQTPAETRIFFWELVVHLSHTLYSLITVHKWRTWVSKQTPRIDETDEKKTNSYCNSRIFSLPGVQISQASTKSCLSCREQQERLTSNTTPIAKIWANSPSLANQHQLNQKSNFVPVGSSRIQPQISLWCPLSTSWCWSSRNQNGAALHIHLHHHSKS